MRPTTDPLNTSGAAQRILDRAVVIPDSCLYYVSQAIFGPYRSEGVGALTPAGKADDVWTYSAARHVGDYFPPAGMPVVFARVTPEGSGDVGISVGGGMAAFTDYPARGRTGIQSIRDRATSIRNPYLGWTADYLGWPLVIPVPLTARKDMHMIYLYNTVKRFWVLINVNTNKELRTTDPKRANGWATAWGNARPVSDDEYLNAKDAIKKTL